MNRNIKKVFLSIMVFSSVVSGKAAKEFLDFKINHRDTNATEALYEAAFKGDLSSVKLLLNRGIDVNARDRDGNTALHGAASGGRAAIAKLLLDKGADVNSKTKYNVTPLMLAATGSKIIYTNVTPHKVTATEANGYANVIRLLLHYGADTTVKDSRGLTALDYAILGRRTKNALLLSQKTKSVPRIGDSAPSFTAHSTKGKIMFPQDYAGKWVIFFSHPADFTPICETEFKKLAHMVKEFERLNTKLLGLSVDSASTHDRWMKNLEKNMDKNYRITFPVIADTSKKVAHAYGMIHPCASTTQTVRSVYFIDPKGTIRALFHYPITNGRNFDEIKRLLIALQTTDKKNIITPVNWQPGQQTLAKTKDRKDALPEYQ